MVYLQVKNNKNEWIDFVDELCPSQIVPSVEFIKNSKRSLGGKLHVDVVATKQSLQITFDVLSQEAFDQVKAIFTTNEANSNGLKVKYFDIVATAANDLGEVRYFHVENLTFNPLILDDGIRWRDVVVDLVEI